MQQSDGVLHAQHVHILLEGHTVGFVKGFAQIRIADKKTIGQIGECQVFCEMIVDIFADFKGHVSYLRLRRDLLRIIV